MEESPTKKNSFKVIGLITVPVIFLIVGIFLGQDIANLNNIINGGTVIEEPVLHQTSLMLDFGNGDIRTYHNLELELAVTVLEQLEYVADQNNLEFLTEINTSKVISINNVANNAALDRGWQYWVNNVAWHSAPVDQQIYVGDVVEWKYTKNQ
ncbi:hypothetical protein CL634_08515 [bacterium]|nr:hypothetical protein [bacterium]|tara:strand:- start:1114 stop:1572 length:459 start_codon:yes stop_codon:yes gene_type:complete